MSNNTLCSLPSTFISIFQDISRQDQAKKKEIKKCPILLDLKQETICGSLDIANLGLDLDCVYILDLDLFLEFCGLRNACSSVQ